MNMRLIRRIGLLVFCVLFISPTQIASANSVAFTVGCSGFTSAGTFLETRRDNTGENQEAFTFVAFDGFGNQIYAPETVRFIVGGSLGLPQGYFRAWSSEPQANPLLLSVVSNAGNGLPERVVYWKTGDCPLLSERGDQAINTLGLPPIDDFDGTTSVSVPVGEVPPDAIGLNNVAELYDQFGYAIVNTPRLNMRTGASVDYTRIAIIDGGTELIVLGRNQNASWWLVQAGDKRGWVSGQYIALRGDVRGASIVPEAGELLPNRFVLFRSTPLRQGPTNLSNTICDAPGNIEFAIIGRDAGFDWYQVQVNCNGSLTTGWLPAEFGAFRAGGVKTIPLTG